MQEEFEARPEKMGAQSLVLRAGVPFDLTGFRQKISQQQYQRDIYTVQEGVTYMDVQIGAEQAYLNDIEVWTQVDLCNAAGVAVVPTDAIGVTLTDMSTLIYGIEVLADSQQICYINDA